MNIEDDLLDVCKQLFTKQRYLSDVELAAIDKHLQHELQIHPTIQSTLPIKPINVPSTTEPRASPQQRKSAAAASRALQEPADDSSDAVVDVDNEDDVYPTGRSFVPTWFQRIGGKDVAELNQPDLLSFLRQWNINLTTDSTSEPVDKATKWRVKMRQSSVPEMQHRVGKLLQRLSQWQADEHANRHLLPTPLQQGYTPTPEQSNQLASPVKTPTSTTPIPTDSPTTSSHYPHGKHIIPHFILLFGSLDLADLTVTDMKYLLQQWNDDVITNLPQFKSLVIPIKAESATNDSPTMTLHEGIDAIALLLHRFNEVRTDPRHVAKLPARMRPVDLNESSAAQRQNRQQKAEKAKQAAAVVAAAKPDARKPADVKPKPPGSSTSNGQSKPTQPSYEIRLNPSKRLFRARDVVKNWGNNPIHTPNTEANPSDYLGYNARDVYRLVKVIFRHLHKHKSSRIDWTKVSAEYLSTYAKVIPEAECKLLWRYLAYRTKPNGSIERTGQILPYAPKLLDDYNDSDIENDVKKHEQQTQEHKQIKDMTFTFNSSGNSSNQSPQQQSQHQPTWSVTVDTVLLDSLWHYSEQWRENIVANWEVEASKKPEYVNSFSTQAGRSELRAQLFKHVYQQPVDATLPKSDVNWNEVVSRMSAKTANHYQWPVTVLKHRWDVLRTLAERDPQLLPHNCTAVARALINNDDNAQYRTQLTAVQQPPHRASSNGLHHQPSADHQMMQEDLTEPSKHEYVTYSPHQYVNPTYLQQSPVQQQPTMMPMQHQQQQQQQYISPVQLQQQQPQYRLAATPPTPLFNHQMSVPVSPTMTADPLVNHCLRLMMACGMQVNDQSVERLNQVATQNPSGNVEFLNQLEYYLQQNNKTVPLRPPQVNEVIRAQHSIQQIHQQFMNGGNSMLQQAFH